MRHVGALGPPPRRGPSAVAADGSNGNPTMGGHPGRSFVHRFRWRLREPPVGVPDRVRGVPRCWDTASPFWSITKDLREARCSSLGGRGGRADALQHDGGPGRRSRGSRLDPGEGSGGSSWSSDRPRPCPSCGWLCRAWGWRRIRLRPPIHWPQSRASWRAVWWPRSSGERGRWPWPSSWGGSSQRRGLEGFPGPRSAGRRPWKRCRHPAGLRHGRRRPHSHQPGASRPAQTSTSPQLLLPLIGLVLSDLTRLSVAFWDPAGGTVGRGERLRRDGDRRAGPGPTSTPTHQGTAGCRSETKGWGRDPPARYARPCVFTESPDAGTDGHPGPLPVRNRALYGGPAPGVRSGCKRRSRSPRPRSMSRGAPWSRSSGLPEPLMQRTGASASRAAAARGSASLWILPRRCGCVSIGEANPSCSLSERADACLSPDLLDRSEDQFLWGLGLTRGHGAATPQGRRSFAASRKHESR
jgi:hypothetical protein